MKIETEDVNTGYTIIIPTYNRPQYLQRILDYYDSFGEKFKIIVADSSSDENKKLNKKIISSVSNLDIQYLDHYSTEINSHHKFADMVNYAEEKYCVFCADDDFVVPNGIKQSVIFLEKNPDFAVAHGYYISFYLKTDKRKKRQFCWTPIYQYKSTIFPDAKSRLIFHFSNYNAATFYAVHRTDFLEMIFRENIEYTNDDRFGELLPTMLTLIYGKMKRLDVLYGAREEIIDSAGRISENINDFITAGTYDEKYAKFRDCLATHLSKNSQLSTKESKKVVDNAMSAYMKRSYNYPGTYIGILIHNIGVILDYLRLPDWIDDGIRTSYRRLFVPKKREEKLLSLSDISPKYYDDFNKIRLHVLSGDT